MPTQTNAYYATCANKQKYFNSLLFDICNIFKTCPSLPYTCTISRNLAKWVDGGIGWWQNAETRSTHSTTIPNQEQKTKTENQKPEPRTKNQNHARIKHQNRESKTKPEDQRPKPGTKNQNWEPKTETENLEPKLIENQKLLVHTTIFCTCMHTATVM